MSTIQGYGASAADLLAQNAQANTKATAMDSTSGTSTSSSSDFLTLLVSELQNQDPTQPTDPNAYVQQLVGVNSLQQLIQINQDMGGSSTTSTGSTSATGSSTTATGAATQV
jgi:flagellar basal-body rod modification protein FlgD